MFQTVLLYFSVLLLVKYSKAVDCYQCDNILNITDCHSLVQCGADEYCFTETTGVGTNTIFNLGCKSKQACLNTSTTAASSSSIIGRSLRSLKGCSQCCALDACNKQICTTGSPAIDSQGCNDDPTFECTTVASVFNICSDIHHAKLKCKRFCGLCNLTDGHWSDWGSWSSCSTSCAIGVITRKRFCNNPAPQDGGLFCEGLNEEWLRCKLRICPVDGRWSAWSSWGVCSNSCGIGLQRRFRSCSNPYPSKDGQMCRGHIENDKPCFNQACKDGDWSSWSGWGSCSASCLGGIQSRTRSCSNPAPSKFGHDCDGDSKETRACNSVACPGQLLHDIRLVNGHSDLSGRVEVFYSKWGTVCDDAFDDDDAAVVCRMLGMETSRPYAKESAFFGQGSLPIILDDLTCQGHEATIFLCPHRTWFSNNCGHGEDASVVCAPLIRLADGSNSHSGRVEVKYNGEWGTVCDDSFSTNEARVVCRSLGLPTSNPRLGHTPGTGRILLDDIKCTGTEKSLEECRHQTWGIHNCNHSEDVSVTC